MKSSSRVAVNTVIIYARMLLTVGINLYSTRLVLNALGSVDYGIFTLIAGIIALLSFVNSAMASSTQRYLSFYQGKKDAFMQKEVFKNSLALHIIIGISLITILEILGYFFINNFLNIPLERQRAAINIYHFMAGTVFFTVITVPFNGSLNAHENMLWVAIVNIIETLLKLLIGIIVTYVSYDKLIVYGIANAGISIVTFILFSVYCIIKYQECSFNRIFNINKKLIKELSSFAGWNLFGVLCILGRLQGLAILLNIFYGSTVNAAYGIANQVGAQSKFFSVNILRVLDPQIMKSEGEMNRMRMLRLSMIASKFGYFLLAFIAIPLIFEMPQVLKFWLKKVPDYTVVFCSLVLIGALFNQLTVGLQSAIQATGNIKKYQLIVGSISLANLPIAYILLLLNMPAYSVLVSYIVIEAIACTMRIYFLNKIAGLSLKEYWDRVIFKELVPTLLSILTCLLITNYIDLKYRFILTIVVSSTVFIVSVLFKGLTDDEKNVVIKMVNKIFKKILKKELLSYNSKLIVEE